MQFLTEKQRTELACRIAFEFAFSDLQRLESYGVEPANGEGWVNLYDVMQIEQPQHGILIPETGELTVLCEQYEHFDVATALAECYELAEYTILQYEKAVLDPTTIK